MKKFLFLFLFAGFCCSISTYPAYGFETRDGYYGPFCITESNETCLGNGPCFAAAYIKKDLYPISERSEPYQYLIEVYPNESVLVPGSNYGIQEFGLNYIYDPTMLEVAVLNRNDDGIDSKWKIEFNSPQHFGPFGIFAIDGDTNGRGRRNPLRLHIASTTEITVYDFYVPNEDDYIFACHIADFTYTGCGSSITSAKFAQLIPQTLIELVLFSAKPEVNKVVLTWATASEIDNAGFNVYRAEAADGEYVKMNEALIPAEGSATAGAAYEFVDENVKLWKKYYYILEDIDINGNATVHDTVSAMPRLIDLLQ